MGKGINIIQDNCDKTAGQDKSLPRDAYLVAYSEDGEEKFDIVCGLQVDIFDHYHDQKKTVRAIEWTNGTINPKFWGYQAKDLGRKKK